MEEIAKVIIKDADKMRPEEVKAVVCFLQKTARELKANSHDYSKRYTARLLWPHKPSGAR